MIKCFIQTITINSKREIPFRISLLSQNDLEDLTIFNFRPEGSIAQRVYKSNNLDRLELLNANPFCDIADELIEVFQDKQLKFLNAKQFILLKSLFRTIGYNFNIKPIYHFSGSKADGEAAIKLQLKLADQYHPNGISYASNLIQSINTNRITAVDCNSNYQQVTTTKLGSLISSFAPKPGVYYFYGVDQTILYVGKAKNLRKRLQAHLSTTDKKSSIDYSKVDDITVEYTGNDIIAQLVESENIKRLQPLYNKQQIKDAAPYIINIGFTAKGIAKASIVRKDYKDNLPERFFNRLSVKSSLKVFCDNHNLCRKHCGLERVKGPCSKITIDHVDCVCSGTEKLEDYNKRFNKAVFIFKNRKSQLIYKLKGRTSQEEAFIYVVNDIYQGYGYIDKEDYISNNYDILSRLIIQTNNYDSSRILSALKKITQPISI